MIILRSHPLLLAAVVTVMSSFALADEEASNRTHVKSSEWGGYYVKSIPAENYGTKGKTLFYAVRDEQDELIHTYDWFATRIYILDNGGSLVQMGPWARGYEATADDLAIAFYKDGKLLKSYSTLDIAGSKDNVSNSVSHYTVIEKVLGYRWLNSNDFAFDVLTHDGRTLSFNPNTGEMMAAQDEENLKILSKVQEIKGNWWYTNREAVEDINNYKVSVDELKAFAPNDFPKIPEGYELTPKGIFEYPEIRKIQ